MRGTGFSTSAFADNGKQRKAQPILYAFIGDVGAPRHILSFLFDVGSVCSGG